MATPARVVQFERPEEVMKAYENMDMPAWSLVQGKQIIFAYEGNDLDEGLQLLEQWCKQLAQSTAIYTLCLFRDGVGEIKSNTPYDRSFNFRFNKPEFVNSGSLGYVQMNNAVESRIAALEKTIKERLDKDDDDDEEEEEKDVVGAITKLAENPLIAAIMGRLLGITIPANRAAMSGVNSTNINADQKLATALKILSECDPELPDHLYSIAMIAKNDPPTYKQLITLLPKV